MGIGNPAQEGRSAAQLDAESLVLDHRAGNGPFVLSARLTLNLSCRGKPLLEFIRLSTATSCGSTLH
jgi:hypothetical protein